MFNLLEFRQHSAADGPIYSPGNRLSLNAKFAATIEAPVLMVMDVGTSTAADIVDRSMICKNTIKEEHAQVIGVVLNQVIYVPQGPIRDTT